MKIPELHRLVMQGDVVGVARLLSAGRVDIDAYDHSGRTALMRAAQDRNVDIRVLELLLQHGANLNLQSSGSYGLCSTAIVFAVSGGDPDKVARLIDAGASIHYVDAHGHDALLNAVHNREVARDSRLLDLLKLLISCGVELDRITDYQESALRVLSRLGRFDAVKLLLSAGADASQLKWTELHRATALGAVAEMERLLESGHSAEDRDWWQRTPWLLAILAGDIDKAQLLKNYGADTKTRGRCGQTPLAFAVMGAREDMLRWLIEAGQDVQQTDDFEQTPLFQAVEGDELACASILLASGADIDHRDHIPQTALANSRSRAMTKLLLDAGADVRELSREAQRGLIGLPPDADPEALATITADEFARGRKCRFGTSNPEVIDEPFWLAMIHSGVNGYIATQTFPGPSSHERGPVWCADRFGQSITFLPDGRIVQIAGEHEDSYDPDFCIYNDVFVHAPKGRILVYGYPESVFPPTDFHTATLIGPHIYMIGSVGYYGKRQYGHTPVYRLHTQTFAIEIVECTGDAPGWISRHTARLRLAHEIEIRSGKVLTSNGDTEDYEDNDGTFVLDVERRAWRRL